MKKFVILSLLALSCGASSVNAGLVPEIFLSQAARDRRAQKRVEELDRKNGLEIDRRMKEERVIDRGIETGVKVGAGILAASYLCSWTGGACASVCTVVPVTWPFLVPTVLAVGGIVGAGKCAIESRRIVVDVVDTSLFGCPR